jgi:hypothetical protein
MLPKKVSPNGVSYKWIAAFMGTAILSLVAYHETQKSARLAVAVKMSHENARRLVRIEARQDAIEGRMIRMDAKLDALLAENGRP